MTELKNVTKTGSKRNGKRKWNRKNKKHLNPSHDNNPNCMQIKWNKPI